jgi:hypothetical protein
MEKNEPTTFSIHFSATLKALFSFALLQALIFRYKIKSRRNVTCGIESERERERERRRWVWLAAKR